MGKTVKIKKSHIKLALILAIAVIAAIIVLQLDKPGQEKKPEQEPVITELKDTSKIAEPGDLVTINYVLRLDNGKIVDTNDPELAKEAELTTYVKGPFKFIIGQSNKIATFDKAIEGMKAGEKKTVIIKPIEPVLSLKINRTEHKPRRMLYSRIKTFTFQKYNETFPGEPMKAGNMLSNPDKYPWPLQITNITEKYVVTQIMTNAGASFTVPEQEWKSQVLRISDRVIELVQNPKIGQIFQTPYGQAEIINVTISSILFTHAPEQGKTFQQKITDGQQAGYQFDFEVLDIDEQEFTIRRINYLPQELMNLEAEILELVKDVKELE